MKGRAWCKTRVAPDDLGFGVPDATKDADDLAGAEVRVEVHHEVRGGGHDHAERLAGGAASADGPLVRHAWHHLVLLLV